jgi:hypothetical protein
MQKQGEDALISRIGNIPTLLNPNTSLHMYTPLVGIWLLRARQAKHLTVPAARQNDPVTISTKINIKPLELSERCILGSTRKMRAPTGIRIKQQQER